jgi:hypothetical protein
MSTNQQSLKQACCWVFHLHCLRKTLSDSASQQVECIKITPFLPRWPIFILIVSKAKVNSLKLQQLHYEIFLIPQNIQLD